MELSHPFIRGSKISTQSRGTTVRSSVIVRFEELSLFEKSTLLKLGFAILHTFLGFYCYSQLMTHIT